MQVVERYERRKNVDFNCEDSIAYNATYCNLRNIKEQYKICKQCRGYFFLLDMSSDLISPLVWRMTREVTALCMITPNMKRNCIGTNIVFMVLLMKLKSF